MALKKRAGNDRRAVQNAMKTLLANIRFASVDKPIQTLAVTSSKPKEGKSTTACNLARAIASSGASVVLVECDMRRRSLANMLGVHSSGGIYAVLSEQATLDEALVEVDQPGMFFLDCEPHIPNPADLIASRRFADLISQLENRFNYVVVDTPPVGAFVDAAEIGQLVDGVIFVIRENYTRRKEVVDAVAQLRKAEVHIIGTVMNCCENIGNEYYYSYYSKDGSYHKSGAGQPDPVADGVLSAPVKLEPASRTKRPSGSRFAKR